MKPLHQRAQSQRWPGYLLLRESDFLNIEKWNEIQTLNKLRQVGLLEPGHFPLKSKS